MKWKSSSGFVSLTYGIDVPLVKPYIADMTTPALDAAETCPRPQRADARRNRERVLTAARKVFAREGRDAQMDDIARVAKVGVGTVYRHFPTKEALIRALLSSRMEQIAAICREELDNPDPWDALRRALWRGAELGAGDRGLSDVFRERLEEIEAAHAAQEEAFAAMAELIARAQAAGRARPDLRPEDIPSLMCGVTQAMHRPGAGPDDWQRHLSIIIDGLRAHAGVKPLPGG